MNPEHMDDRPLYDRPSKSQIKREAEALQKAGEALVDLTPGRLARIPLPDVLRNAVTEAAKLRNKHAAFKRQRQFIGKLMREVDAEPILEALNDIESQHRAETSRFHEIERWRDALLGEESGSALTELLASFPAADVQMLRRQISKAQREMQTGHGRHEQRDLFAMLRGMIENS